MGSLGRHLLSNNSGNPVSIIAGSGTQYRTGGCTIDWTLITAAPADITLADGLFVKAGQKYIPMGQVMAKIGTAAGVVVTLNNTPTGGTFTLTLTRNGVAQTTGAIAFNASAATVQTAVRAISNGAGGTVTGSAGGPYTVEFPDSLGVVTVTASGTSLTGAGAQPTATVGAGEAGGNAGYFGPFDPNASDGRQTLVRGDCGIVPFTLLQDGPLGLGLHDTDHWGLVVGGRVWNSRVLHSGTATHTLAAGPTRAELEAAMPTITIVKAA